MKKTELYCSDVCCLMVVSELYCSDVCCSMVVSKFCESFYTGLRHLVELQVQCGTFPPILLWLSIHIEIERINEAL